MTEALNLSNYQVVRTDFVDGGNEPQLTFNRGRIYINSYGLSLFPTEDYIRVLVDDESKSIVIEPFTKKQKDSFKWCAGEGKRRPRHMRCMPLFYLVFRMMSWDPDSRYRITGTLEEEGEKKVLYFGLRDAVCFQTTDERNENGKPVIRQRFPQNWLESYGMPLADYNSRQDIRTFEDAVVFDVEFKADKEKAERLKALQKQIITNESEGDDDGRCDNN